MNIYFDNIKIHNFLSIGDIELDYTNDGFNLISGINKCVGDNANSNGAGKSSLFDALSWVLTGQTTRGIKDVKNIYLEDGTVVELSFRIDNNNYKLLRSKDSKEYKTTLRIFINGEDKSGKGIRDSEIKLKELLPDLDINLINSILILGQGLPGKFTNNTPSGRKEILEQLTKSDYMINDLKDRISTEKNKLNGQIRICEDNILQDTTSLTIYQNNLTKLNTALDNLPNIDKLIEELKSIDSELNDINKNLIDKKEKYDLTNNKLQDIKDNKTTLSENKINAVNDIKIKHQEKASQIEKQVLTEQITVKDLKNKINELKSIKDICPTCKQKIIGVEKPDITPYKNDLANAEEKLNNLKTEYSDFVTPLNKSIEECKLYWDNQINNVDKDIINTTAELNSINGEIQKLQSNEKSISFRKQTIQVQIDNFESNKSNIIKDIDNTEASIKEKQDKILYNNNEKDNLVQRLDVVNKMWTYATRDFRTVLLNNIITFINNKCKEYCKLLFNTDNIEFMNNNNNISIYYNEKPYENLSGGEKQKIDIIVQFAIRDMLCKYCDFSSNILVLDEIFDNLDSQGCSNVIDLITEELKDVLSVYIISHHSNELNIPYDNIINVVKDDRGITSLM